MRTPRSSNRISLRNGARVAVVGGGPAGAFFALHLLREARTTGREIHVTVFERRWLKQAEGACALERWSGCNYCAGGISPKLSEVLNELGIHLPADLVQSRIRSITVQGFWKNIELEVPPDRKMLAVYRGSRPERFSSRHGGFDSFLLDQAVGEGAELMRGDVLDVERAQDGKLMIRYSAQGSRAELAADIVVFAAGVNEQPGIDLRQSRTMRCLQRLMPDFVPPQVRPALIFELETLPAQPSHLESTIHFVEYGSRHLRLEMCSLVPKRGYITVVLVGPSVDALSGCGSARRIIADFLELPHIRKLIPRGLEVHPACACRPNMVVRSARNPWSDRVAAIGDIVTARLYKDGILSAHRTAQALARTILHVGVDAASLEQGYGPTLERFRSDNRIASIVFLLHRLFFSSSVLSRVLYQAAITERKTTPAPRRRLESILWRIASGDDEYREIFAAMTRFRTIWSILVGGGVLTLRNYLTEVFFGLRWEGIGRYTTGVAIERLEEKRKEFSRLMLDASVNVPGQLEFERMYTIRIGASRQDILDFLGTFGEPDRGFLTPRWVTIRRVAGLPNCPGCVIRYEFFNRRFSFNLKFEQIAGGHLAIYRVLDGFARGGMLLFEIEELHRDACALSIYVAFNFPRGTEWLTKPFWCLFRLLFPAFVHDVLWNHSLCQLKDIVEQNALARGTMPVATGPGAAPAGTLSLAPIATATRAVDR